MLRPTWVKFSPGELVITPGALMAFHYSMDRIVPLLVRHVSGDWGDLDPEDHRANDMALINGYRLLSSYTLSDGTKVWFITEAGRQSTTVLRPEEY